MKPLYFTLIFLAASLASAATINVPADFPTIQEGIDAAQNGDEVVISPGVYIYADPILISKQITLRSTYDGKNRDIVKNTVIRNTTQQTIIFLISHNVIIRGLTLSRDPITIPSSGSYSFIARGISATGGAMTIIEDNIIENCVSKSNQGNISGAGITGINGAIERNIIRNCVGGAIIASSGILRNNMLYNNIDGDIGLNNEGTVTNNTVYGNGSSFSSFYVVMNNIFWNPTGAAYSYDGAIPKNCLIKGYTGSGTGIITSDPKFVNAAGGDFRLQADSPAIDAGITIGGLKSDINGVQRGLQGVQQLRGDGSAVDIGAYEFIPEPVGVWLPGGGPDLIESGDILTVSWKQTEAAGTAILLRLMAQGVPVVDYGAFYSPTSQAEQNLQLPSSLPTHNSYWIQARSSFNPSLTSNTPFFRIQNPQNLIPASVWSLYR